MSLTVRMQKDKKGPWEQRGDGQSMGDKARSWKNKCKIHHFFYFNSEKAYKSFMHLKSS